MGIKVDLGCGRNKRDNPDAVGVDSDPKVNPNIVANITQKIWALEDGCASLVTCNHVLEHLSNNLYLDVFVETIRLLESGGRFEFRVPHPSDDSSMIHGHIHVFTPRWWREEQERNPMLPNFFIDSVTEVPNKKTQHFCLIKGLIFEEWAEVLRNSYTETLVVGHKE